MFKPAICTQCGAGIEVDDSKEAGICENCNTAFITERVVNNFINNTNHHTTQNIYKTIIGQEKNEAEDYIKNGEVFLSLQEWDGAYKAFKSAVDADPADYRGWLGIARSCSKNFSRLQTYNDPGYYNAIGKALALAPPEQKKEWETKHRSLTGDSKDPVGTLSKYQGSSPSVFLDKSNKIIGAYAFFNTKFIDYKRITHINLPSKLEKIGDSAFWGCTGVGRITIPSSVKVVGAGAFGQWERHQEIRILGGKAQAKPWGKGWKKGCKAKIKYG